MDEEPKGESLEGSSEGEPEDEKDPDDGWYIFFHNYLKNNSTCFYNG